MLLDLEAIFEVDAKLAAVSASSRYSPPPALVSGTGCVSWRQTRPISRSETSDSRTRLEPGTGDKGHNRPRPGDRQVEGAGVSLARLRQEHPFVSHMLEGTVAEGLAFSCCPARSVTVPRVTTPNRSVAGISGLGIRRRNGARAKPPLLSLLRRGRLRL